ncbi:MAG TPA: GNAT family N-acetyltransferase [Candidatus Limnocylindrales bacterium]|nr:GNAT family N-acetyltransferase [Candidatus Limnocylindrales bacterium]
MEIGTEAGAAFRVERPADADAFLALAGDFLDASEAEHCLILGLAGNLQRGVMPLEEPPLFALVVDGAAGDRVVAAALRTPPYNLVVSMVGDLDAVDALAEALAGSSLPGVSAPREVAEGFAASWTARTGRRSRRSMAERIFRLDAVREPRPASGRMRLAERADRALLIAWIEAFTLEALGKSEDMAAGVDRWLEHRGRRLWLWEDGDLRVSLCGAGGETAHGIRIGPVYTPPEHRGHGYASNLVAGVSQLLLDEGRQFVTLFTDLANPTSNRIYQDVGYAPVIDFEVVDFID